MTGIWFWLGLWVIASTVLSLFVGKWIKACKGPRLTWDDEAEHWRRAAERHQSGTMEGIPIKEYKFLQMQKNAASARIAEKFSSFQRPKGDEYTGVVVKSNGDSGVELCASIHAEVDPLTTKEFIGAYGPAMAKDMVRYAHSPCGTFYVCAKCGLPIELDGPCYGCASVPSKPLEGDWQAKMKWPDLRHGEPLPFEGEGDSERARR